MSIVRNIFSDPCLRLAVLLMLTPMKSSARPWTTASDSVFFSCRELLGRPTATSVALNMCADTSLEMYVEYGTQPSTYGSQTIVSNVSARIPVTIQLSGLTPDTKYYYRARYRTLGTMAFDSLGEHTFHTARPAGSSFVFAIEADPHIDTSTSVDLFKKTLTNILLGDPDFLIDLGDTFMSDKLPVKSPQEVLARHLLLRSFFDTLCHSVPLMLVLGNHEGEQGWLLNGTPDNLAIWTTNIRNSYYPNPVPNGFYSGDTTEMEFIGLRHDYYAWEWGSALFVVLDPYWYTTRKPGTSKSNWDWTLGKAQYEWFKRTLEQSTAKLKFVFAHQIIGGIDLEGRGGIEGVPFYEMGGLNSDSTWGFDTNRPGWGKPIHKLMQDHNVQAFFHGHDHVFVKQDLGGIVYQELPQPAYFNFNNPAKSYSNISQATAYGYTHGDVLPSSGYLRVSVVDTVATVAYVRSYLPEHENAQRHNGDVAYSYILTPSGTATAVAENPSIPGTMSLSQNFPNPFNPLTTIEFSLSVESSTRLSVMDVLGREVALLIDGRLERGVHTVRWNASGYASGIYYCRLVSGEQTIVRPMMLLK